MTPEERQMLTDLFERIKATSGTPRDPEAEAFINDAVRPTPFAPYVLAQTVLVQQRALEAAAQRLAELEAQRQGGDQAEHGSFLGNLSRTIFGGGPSAPSRQTPDPSAYPRGPGPAAGPGYGPPPPQPQAYGAPQPQPGPWGGAPAAGGGGFLQNAASTAAGVAGGVALGSLLGGLFGSHQGGGMFGGGFGGGGFPGGGETINNFYEAPQGGDSDQFQPSAPDDAGFLDDSSFNDSSGGGFDDV
jgi:uncharacterized protein